MGRRPTTRVSAAGQDPVADCSTLGRGGGDDQATSPPTDSREGIIAFTIARYEKDIRATTTDSDVIVTLGRRSVTPAHLADMIRHLRHDSTRVLVGCNGDGTGKESVFVTVGRVPVNPASDIFIENRRVVLLSDETALGKAVVSAADSGKTGTYHFTRKGEEKSLFVRHVPISVHAG